MQRLILFFLCFTGAGIAQTYSAGSFPAGAVPAAGIAAGTLRNAAEPGLRQAFERATYSLTDSGKGTYRGANPAQHLSLEFNDREVRIGHPRGDLTLRLTGYGYADILRKPAAAKLAAAGDRIEYQRGDLTEWYRNRADGLEQGFTLARRPDGAGGKGSLAISFDIAGLAVSRAQAGTVQAGSVLRYSGLKAVDARGRVLLSRMEVVGQSVRLLVDEKDAKYPVVVDPTWTQQQELTASDGAANDRFGDSVSVSGDTAVIGANRKNGSRGAAYIFVRSAGVWSPQQELTASDGAAGDQFGDSVSVSGDTAVVGAFGKNGEGAAYVFVRSGGTWTRQQELTASDSAAGDQFGYSVSVSGNTAAIGACGKNNQLGAAYVFVRSGASWTQQQEFTDANGTANEGFGYSVSMSGDTAVIGAGGANSSQGAAYVFVRRGVTWTQQQGLTASDGAAGDRFGSAVSVSGDTTVIGAFQKAGQAGAVYVFARSGAVWIQQQELTASDGGAVDCFGYAVTVSGDTAVIGANCLDNSQGAAFVFARSGGVWSRQQVLTASDGSAGDNFGSSVSVSGNTAAIGAAFKNSTQGAAYLFVTPILGTKSLLFSSGSGTSSVELSTSLPWTAASNDSFLHVSSGSASGTGSALVAFAYDAFAGTGTRTGTLTIAGLTLTVTQVGTNYLGPDGSMNLRFSSQPAGVAVDGVGNLYVGGGGLSELNVAAGTWGTVGTPAVNMPGAIAVDAAGNIYFADSANNAVEQWSPSTQQSITLVSAGLSGPSGVAVDASGNVYIADTGNNAIKEWNVATQQLTVLVSTGLNAPSGVAVDALGNVYFSDTENNAIKEWVAATQHAITLVSTGLNQPLGVAVDGSGNVYFIPNSLAGSVQEWIAATQQVIMLNSTGLSRPLGVAVDSGGNVYVSDAANGVVVISNVFVGPDNLSEPSSYGTDTLSVVPATTALSGIFAPPCYLTSWLNCSSPSSGAVKLSFYQTDSWQTRSASVSVRGLGITVTQAAGAPLLLTIAHQGNFVQGQQGATYTITVSNPIGGADNAAESIFGQVTDQIPSGLTRVSMVRVSGYGTCISEDFGCTFTDYPGPGQSMSYLVTVNVAANAPATVTNSALLQVTADLSFLDVTASDPTTIVPFAITTATVPVATQYRSYNTPLTVLGGTPPYTWSVASSTGVGLPEGMSLDPATGLVSAAQVNGQGGYAVTVHVTDSTSPTPIVATATIDFGVNSDTTYGGCQMFPADSIFNQPAALLPPDTNPGDQIPTGSLASPLTPGFGRGFSPGPNGIPFMRVPANQAATKVNLANAGQIDGAGTYQWPLPAWSNALVEGTADGLAGNDHHILVLQSSANNISGPQTGACTLYETYQNIAVPSMYDAGSSTWSLAAGSHYVLNSDEIATSPSTLDNGAQDSSGIPLVPLLMKYSDVLQGAQHPLSITMPSPTNWYVWPATGCCAGSGPPQGLLYRLKAGVNWQAVCPVSTNPQAATVLQALQQYGAYMTAHDTAGSIAGVPDVRWNDADLACIAKFPVSDLEVVDNSVLEVSAIGGQTQPYVAPSTLAGGLVGSAYSATLAEVGGNPSTLQWSVTSGGLPPGLTLNASTGTIAGIPTSIAGSPYSFGVTATDTASKYASQAQKFSIAVSGAGGSMILTIMSGQCDVTRQGLSTVVNAQAIINEALGVAPAIHDWNGDGRVNMVDIQIVVKAVLNSGCTV